MVIPGKIKAREVLDSRGFPTLEVELYAEGKKAKALVPAGASTGSFEVLELRDGGTRLQGKGVKKAVHHVLKEIAPHLLHAPISSQKELDELLLHLDSTKNKSKLGANAILGVSLAFARLQALLENLPLYEHIQALFSSYLPDQASPFLFSRLPSSKMPIPFLNVINGGLHASNNLDCQEFMIVPLLHHSFREKLFSACEVYHALKSLLKERHLSFAVGDEGGFAPDFNTEEEALEILIQSIEKAGFQPGKEIALALDVAASSFPFHEGTYFLPKKKESWTREKCLHRYEQWVATFPIVSLEDPLHEEDWEGWNLITERLGQKVQLVGDDIFVTNPERLQKGIAEKCANAILIKPNQIGTLSETLAVMAQAREAGYHQMVSHRSGETEDVFIAHLAVGTGCGQIKSGAPARGERTAKYNELLRIEEELEELREVSLPT